MPVFRRNYTHECWNVHNEHHCQLWCLEMFQMFKWSWTALDRSWWSNALEPCAEFKWFCVTRKLLVFVFFTKQQLKQLFFHPKESAMHDIHCSPINKTVHRQVWKKGGSLYALLHYSGTNGSVSSFLHTYISSLSTLGSEMIDMTSRTFLCLIILPSLSWIQTTMAAHCAVVLD